MGSSAARITIAECGPRGLETLYQHRYPVRLGRYAFAAGGSRVGPAGVSELVGAAHAMREQMAHCHVVRARAIATSALREAENGPAVAEQVGIALGVPLEIISGAQEARLAKVALGHALELSGQPLPTEAVMLDLGGGSTELTTLRRDLAVSLPLGSVRLLAAEPTLASALGPQEVAGLRERTRQRVQGLLAHSPFQPFLPSLHAQLIGSGGNLHALARAAPPILRQEAREPAASKRPGHTICLAELSRILPAVAALTIEERAKAYDLSPERADLFVPAILLIEALASAFAADAIWVPGTGLRDALLLELMPAC